MTQRLGEGSNACKERLWECSEKKGGRSGRLSLSMSAFGRQQESLFCDLDWKSSLSAQRGNGG